MVDAADSKSAAFTGVRVRVSPRAPFKNYFLLIININILIYVVNIWEEVINIFDRYLDFELII